MNPIHFQQSNRTYVKPESMTDEQCGSLPVFVGVDTDGFPLILSKWELSDEELEQINENKAVWLNVVSSEMPPVSLFVQNPFETPVEPEYPTKRQIMELNAATCEQLVKEIKEEYPFVKDFYYSEHEGTWQVKYHAGSDEEFSSVWHAMQTLEEWANVKANKKQED